MREFHMQYCNGISTLLLERLSTETPFYIIRTDIGAANPTVLLELDLGGKHLVLLGPIARVYCSALILLYDASKL
jgi:hypothetical protein